MADQEDSLVEEQNEEYMKLREAGLSKQEAAAKAAPPSTTKERVKEI